MKLNRFVAGVLATASLCAVLPAVSPAADSTFRDIPDPVLAEKCELLRLLGVVNGKEDGSYFDPEGVFTRAEFVKMAVCALERAGDEPAQRSRTIYLDVGPTFWARGYINLASSIRMGSSENATPLVMGSGDGNFFPLRAITYGEAVTILCRILGYGTDDAFTGGAWYDGYLALAKKAGLTHDVELSGTATLTRAQAASLFYNLYFAEIKGSDKTYLVSLGGSESENAVVLNTNATADDGTTGCFQTTGATYKTNRKFDPALAGQEGKSILDKDGKLLAFQTKTGTSDRTVTAEEVKSNQMVTANGQKITLKDDTTVYRENKKTTWSEVYAKVMDHLPAPVGLHYGSDGKLSYVYFPAAGEDETSTVMVARDVPRNGINPFASMAGDKSYTMYKNGLVAMAEDIRQYDVAIWEPSTRTIQISDLKLTGVYESASPNPADPVKMKLLGCELSVLPEARDELSRFKLGEQITLLLTAHGEVAGVVAGESLKSSAIGLASVSGTSASVRLLGSDLEVHGSTYSEAAERYNNQLVTVISSELGKLSLSGVSGTLVKGDWNVSAETLAGKAVGRNVTVYDRVPDGVLVEVNRDQLPAVITQEHIGFALYDYAGRAICIVLDDATGDAYTYGYLSYSKGEQIKVPIYQNPDEGDYTVIGYRISEEGPDQLRVRKSNGSSEETFSAAASVFQSYRNDVPGGIAYTSDGKLAGVVLLKALRGVGKAAVDTEEMTATIGGVVYPIAADVQIYNLTTELWSVPGEEGLKAARAYSKEMNLWYDRDPSQGGKIRLIELP